MIVEDNTMTEEFEFVEIENIDEPFETLEVEEEKASLPEVFTNPPERIGNPRSPFKGYFILDYDKVVRLAGNANDRIRGKCHYAVITEDANDYPKSFDTILWWAIQSLVSGGILYVHDEYTDHEFLSDWKKGKKKNGYIPYTKP